MAPATNNDEMSPRVPINDVESLGRVGPTPPERHYHMSNDVRNKVDLPSWLSRNQDDPALEVNL